MGKTTSAVVTLKAEHQEVQLESDPATSSPRSAAQELPEPTRKPARRRAPRAKKSKAVKAEPKESSMLPVSAAAVPLGLPLPSLSLVTSSIVHDKDQNTTLPATPDSALKPKYHSGHPPVVNSNEIYSSTGYSALGADCRQISSAYIQRGPIMRSNFRHSFADDYAQVSDAASRPKKSLDSESQRPSSPTSSEIGTSMTTTRSEATIALTSYNELVTSAGMTGLWGNGRSDIILWSSSNSRANRFNPTGFNSSVQ